MNDWRKSSIVIFADDEVADGPVIVTYDRNQRYLDTDIVKADDAYNRDDDEWSFGLIS